MRKVFYLDFPIPDYNNEFVRLACSNYVHEITDALTDCVHTYIQDSIQWALFSRWNNFEPRHRAFILDLEEHHGVRLASHDYTYERDEKPASRYRPFGISRQHMYNGLGGLMGYVSPSLFITLEHVALESYIVKTFFEYGKELRGMMVDSTIGPRFVSACDAALAHLTFKVGVSYQKIVDVEDRVMRSTGRVVGGGTVVIGHEFTFLREGSPRAQHPKIILQCSHDFSQVDVHLDLPNLGRMPGGTWCIPGVDFFLPRSVCVSLN